MAFGGINLLAAVSTIGAAGIIISFRSWVTLSLAIVLGLNLIFISLFQLTNQTELWEGYKKGVINTLKYLLMALFWGFFSYILIIMSVWMGIIVYETTRIRPPWIERSDNNTLLILTIFMSVVMGLIGVVYLTYKAVQDGRAWWAEPQSIFDEEKELIICPSCQNENPSTKKQCYVCGTPLT